MYANGFFEEQQRRSPTSFALVVALHAAGLGAVILGSTQFIQAPTTRTTVRDIAIPDDPPPEKQREPVEDRQPQHRETVITPIPTETPPTGPTATAGRNEPTLPTGPIGERNVEPARDPPQDPPPPVRREAQLDSRYAGDLQPPYPRSEESAQRSGVVRIRLTIAPNGRVTAVERLSATNDAFWRVTERQALNRWRFHPATLDGRPVQGVKVMTVNFRIQDA
jgi:protein TonB